MQVATPAAAKKAIAQPAKAGYEAQGWALAQTIIAINRSVRSDLKRAILGAFDLAVEAREAAIKALGADLKACTEVVKTTMPGIDKPQRTAGTATVYASQCRTILRAMNNGMSRTVMLALLFPGVECDEAATIESLGFDSILHAARQYNDAEASGKKRGRTPDAWLVKLGKWLEKNAPADDDVAGIAQFNAILTVYNTEMEKMQAVV